MKTLARGLKGGNPNEWFNKNRVNIPGMKEVIYQPLYDTQVYEAAGNQSITFFGDKIGSNGKSLSQTNMDLDGQLPSGQAFLITGIQVAFVFGGNLEADDVSDDINFINDLRTFAENGSLTLRIQSKDYLRQAPLGKFPPVERLAVGVSGADGAVGFTLSTYCTTAGREFSVRDLLLESNQNFSVELRDLPALPSTIDAELIVTLNGFLGRNAQ